MLRIYYEYSIAALLSYILELKQTDKITYLQFYNFSYRIML